MKYGIKCNGTPKFFVKYEGNEWNELSLKLESMGLRKATTSQMWGGQSGTYYREENSELRRMVQNTLIVNDTTIDYSLCDDINAQFISASNQSSFNVAIFRVIPDSDGYIIVDIPKFLNVLELNRIGKTVSAIYQVLFNVVVNAEVTIERRTTTPATNGGAF